MVAKWLLDKLAAQALAPVTTAPLPALSVTDTKAGNGQNAKKQADYRQRKGEAGRKADAQRKRAARAKITK